MTRRALSLAADRQLLDAWFESLSGLAFAIDEAGRFLRWNSNYQRLLGLSDEAMTELNGFELVAERDRERLAAAFSEILRSGRAEIECTLAYGGREMPIYGTGLSVQLDGKTYVVGTVFDISARVSAEAAREISEISYRAIFNATSDAIVIHDADGRVTDVNDQMCTLFGCSRDEQIGKNADHFAFLEPPYSHADAQEKLRLAMLEGPQLFVWPCKRPNGEVFWAEVALRATEISGELRTIASVRDVSERMRAESLLRASETRFRQLFDGAVDAVFIHDGRGRIVDVNRATCESLGYTREELLRMSIRDIEIEVEDRALDAIWQAVEAGGSLQAEGTHRRKNGSSFPVDVRVIPITYDDQSLMFAAARDITVRKQAEAESRLNERRLALALSATEDAVWEYNISTGSMYFSPRWYEMLGYADRQFPMDLETYRMLCHPDDLDRADRHYAEVIGSHQSLRSELEFRMRRADGTWAWLLGRGAVTERDAGGNALVYSGTNSDISRRRQAEQEVSEWKQRYDLLTRAAGQIVYDCAVTGEIWWGGVVTTLLGYEPAELQGGITQWEERVHPEDREDVGGKYAQAMRSGTVFETEYRYRHKLGHYLVVQDTGYPQFDEQGQLKRYIGIMADVTERRQADLERRRLEEGLRQAQKMESIGRLAGGIAHDFNNLLTAISGNLSLAMSGETLNDETQELLGEATKAAESAANLTRQLLAFSRKQVIHPKVLSLNDTVWGLQKMLRRLLGEDVELSVKLDGDLGQVEIDEGQIEQVLVNLAVNARDAMPDGGKLTIESANVDLDSDYCRQQGQLEPGGYVMLAVSDDGVGMSPEVKRHLFEPFFTTKDVGKGTGLGLAMAYGAVQQNGGHIVVYSELGLGTTVRLYLPRVDAPKEALKRPKSVLLTRGQETIFVVEDEEQVRTLAVRILTRHGYDVRAFANGEDALLALAQVSQSVHLLLTDVVMPGMNGKALADRATALRPDLRVLYTSGYTEDVIMHHGVLDEGIEFIAKPYSVASLTQGVREVLDRD